MGLLSEEAAGDVLRLGRVNFGGGASGNRLQHEARDIKSLVTLLKPTFAPWRISLASWRCASMA